MRRAAWCDGERSITRTARHGACAVASPRPSPASLQVFRLCSFAENAGSRRYTGVSSALDMLGRKQRIRTNGTPLHAAHPQVYTPRRESLAHLILVNPCCNMPTAAFGSLLAAPEASTGGIGSVQAPPRMQEPNPGLTRAKRRRLGRSGRRTSERRSSGPGIGPPAVKVIGRVSR